MQADGAWPTSARPACGAGCGVQPYVSLSGGWYSFSILSCSKVAYDCLSGGNHAVCMKQLTVCRKGGLRAYAGGL